MTESGTLVVHQNSNDPARPESATQLWVDGRIIHVVSHRHGPVVNLSHLHNRAARLAHGGFEPTEKYVSVVVSPLALPA